MHPKILVAAHRSIRIYVRKTCLVKNSSRIEAWIPVSVSSQLQCFIRDQQVFLGGRRMAQKYMLCKILAMYLTRKRRATGSALRSCCLSVINEVKTNVGDVVICWKTVLMREKGRLLHGVSKGWLRGTSSFHGGSCGHYFHWRKKQNPSKSIERVRWRNYIVKLRKRCGKVMLDN